MVKFEKVSFEQFKKDFLENTYFYKGYEDSDFIDIEVKRVYDLIRLPERKTKKSAGHDFHIPFNISLSPNQDCLIPTGIRCIMEDDDVLMVYPRSSLGFKYYMRIANSTPVIDADYADSDNEGHIFIKIRNEGDKFMELNSGDAFVQGIIVKYQTTDDDNVIQERNGGIGSTN